jgi:hypothetical protein
LSQIYFYADCLKADINKTERPANGPVYFEIYNNSQLNLAMVRADPTTFAAIEAFLIFWGKEGL